MSSRLPDLAFAAAAAALGIGIVFVFRSMYLAEDILPFAQEMTLIFLGAVVTIILTAALLNRQTDLELRKEGRVIILQQQCDIYMACDGPGMFAVRRPLEAPLLPRDQLVLAHQACRAMPPDLMALVDEVAVHARAAIGPVRQREGRPDMRQIDHVLLLTVADRPLLPSEEAALADTQNTAHPADREAGLLRFDEAEGHRLPSSAKKAAAFFKMSRSCFRTAFSRRSLLNSACRSTGASLVSLTSCSSLSHRVSVERPMPRSTAISRRVRPLVSASRTASRRNSGVGLFPFPIEHLLVPQLVLSTFTGQVHSISR